MNPVGFKDFFHYYPHVSIATAADNEPILNFYHQTKLRSEDSDIKYFRGNDFFAFLKERSDSFLVLLLKDDHGVIHGMGVISYRPGFIHDDAVIVGYLGDLRVKMNRKLIREWRAMYAHFLKLSSHWPETHYCRYYQTVLIDENLQSKNNLAMTKIPNLHYHRLASYQMINIVGRLKMAKSFFTVRWAGKNDRDNIENFLSQNTYQNLFAHDWTKEFRRRLNEWNNFDLNDYLLVFDGQKKLIAITSAWNPIHTKQITLSKIPAALKLLKFIPLVEMRLLPPVNQPIEILYINQIAYAHSLEANDREKVTNDLLHFAFSKKFHILAYADFENENYLKNSKGFIMQKMPMALYSVHYKNEDGSILYPLSWAKENPAPYFDMSLV